jgi:hypothetical protein
MNGVIKKLVEKNQTRLAKKLQIPMMSPSGWWYTYPSEKYESQIESSSKLLGKLKHVPNHQPDNTMLLSLYT